MQFRLFACLVILKLVNAGAADNHPIYEKLQGLWIGDYNYYGGDGECYPSSDYVPG